MHSGADGCGGDGLVWLVVCLGGGRQHSALCRVAVAWDAIHIHLSLPLASLLRLNLNDNLRRTLIPTLTSPPSAPSCFWIQPSSTASHHPTHARLLFVLVCSRLGLVGCLRSRPVLPHLCRTAFTAFSFRRFNHTTDRCPTCVARANLRIVSSDQPIGTFPVPRPRQSRRHSQTRP